MHALSNHVRGTEASVDCVGLHHVNMIGELTEQPDHMQVVPGPEVVYQDDHGAVFGQAVETDGKLRGKVSDLLDMPWTSDPIRRPHELASADDEIKRSFEERLGWEE